MIIITSIICGIFGSLLMALFLVRQKIEYIDVFNRLRYYSEVRKKSSKNTIQTNEAPQTFTDSLLVTVQRLAEPLKNFRPVEKYDHMMRKAGLPMDGSEFVTILIGSIVLTGGFTMMLTLDYLTAAGVALTVVMIEYLFVLYKIKKRRQTFSNQLGDCLVTLANSLRAGFSFMQAMDLISQEMEPPISEEFAQAIQEMSAGVTLEQTLENMDERMQNPDFSLMVTAVLIQREVGGNLAQILDTISTTIDERIRMKREINALTAQGRMSGYVLAGLPVGMILILNIVSPGRFDPILQSEIAPFLIGGCIFLEILGFIVIQWIVDIDV